MSSRRDQISAGVTRYLRRYLQISAQISADICADIIICRYHLQIFMSKCVPCNTIQYYLLEAQLPCLRRRTQIARSPRTDLVRRVFRIRCDRVPARRHRRRRHVVVRHRRRPGPPPPAGRRNRFQGGAGGCRRCCRHSCSCSPRCQGDAQHRRRQDGGRRQALPDPHPPCPSPLATSP